MGQRSERTARSVSDEAARLHGGDYVVEQTIFEELVPRNLASLVHDSELVVVRGLLAVCPFCHPTNG